MSPAEQEFVLALIATAPTRQKMVGSLEAKVRRRKVSKKAFFFYEAASALAGRSYFRHAGWAYERAIALYKEAGLPYQIFACKVNLALAYDRLSRYKAAVHLLHKALRFLARHWTGDWQSSKKLLESDALRNLATTLLNLGETGLALEYNLAAKALKESVGDQVGLIDVLIGLANTHRDLLQLGPAEDYYKQAHDLAIALEWTAAVGKCAQGLGNIYMSYTDRKQAIRWYQEALEVNLALEREKNGLEDLPSCYVNLGNAYHELALEGSHPDEALSPQAQQLLLTAAEHYKNAKEVTPEDDLFSRADILQKCAALAADLGKFPEAEAAFKAALSLARRSGNYYVRFEATMGMGDLAFKRHDPDQSIAHYHTALTLSEKKHPNHESIACSHLGHAYLEKGELEHAITYLARSIHISESLGKGFVAEQKKIGYFSATQSDYELLIHACVMAGDTGKAFHYLEKSKSKALLGMLGTGELPLPIPVSSPQLVAEEQSYRQQMRRWMRSENATGPDVQRVLDKLSALYLALEREAPQYVSIRRGDALSFESLKAHLVH